MIGAQELQKAVFDKLSDDVTLSDLLGGRRIYDTPPQGAKLPYVSFGELSATDWSTSDGSGAAFNFSVRCWTNERGRKSIHAISERIGVLLQSPIEFDAAAHTSLVLIHPLGMRLSNSARNSLIQATLRFRALIEVSQ